MCSLGICAEMKKQSHPTPITFELCALSCQTHYLFSKVVMLAPPAIPSNFWPRYRHRRTIPEAEKLHLGYFDEARIRNRCPTMPPPRLHRTAAIHRPRYRPHGGRRHTPFHRNDRHRTVRKSPNRRQRRHTTSTSLQTRARSLALRSPVR